VAVAHKVGQKAEARTVTLPNMAEAAGEQATLAEVKGQAEALFTAEAVEAEHPEITLRPKPVAHGVHMRLVAAEPVARQRL
jgi:hypothetical protein